MTMIDVKMEQSTESTSGTREAEMPGSEGTSSSSETVVSILESWHPPRPSDLARRRKLATNPPHEKNRHCLQAKYMYMYCMYELLEIMKALKCKTLGASVITKYGST